MRETFRLFSNKSIVTIMVLLTAIGTQAQNQLQSPSEFLGYELGSRFTRHHKVVEYYRHVATVMSNVKVEQYGVTNELRPLVLAFISSQQNFDRLEQIRLNNLRRARLAEGAATDEDIAIVWLSYNVHGNESSSTEATMKTLYELANPQNSKTQEWLKNTVVIMDPCINPDGRDRYANFFNQYGNRIPNPNLDSKEHHEPWPGGRTNHYMFDLNRDWAWLTQVESQHRIKYYSQWMPHVHVDFHEQSLNSPYYFAPAAEPYHEVITPWQREFQTLIGKNHAKYFDAEGWIYFTKEVFDLFYPSYGDTYPTYNGAIGMTYEKGGGGRAGLEGLMANGDTVKLSDRLEHHHTTGLSTVEVSSVNATRLMDEFSKYFNEAIINPSGTYKTYVIKESNHADKIRDLTKWLDSHEIRYGTGSSSGKRVTGFSYRSGGNSSVTVTGTDLLVSAYQPKSRLVKALFEPDPKLVDSLTYDITAWAVPYMYDLEAYALPERVNVTGKFNVPQVDMATSDGEMYAYAAKYETLHDLKWKADLLNQGVKVRVALEDFSIEGKSFTKGTTVVLKWDNYHVENFDGLVSSISQDHGQEVFGLKSGLVDSGKDFGSRYYSLIKPPSIALLAGSETSSQGFGQMWYFFEQDINYPLTVIDTDRFNRVDLERYDVLVVPDGFYRMFGEDGRKDLVSWVRGGGRLVLVGSALNSFVDTDEFGLTSYLTEDEEKEAEEKEEKQDLSMVDLRYGDALRESIKSGMPGAIYRARVDNTNPLAFGYPNYYFTLKLHSSRYAYLKDGWNVATIDSPGNLVSGFVGSKVKDQLGKTLVFGVEEMGGGSVVYMVDNPLFRAFWQNGKLFFGNAVFMPQ